MKINSKAFLLFLVVISFVACENQNKQQEQDGTTQKEKTRVRRWSCQ